MSEMVAAYDYTDEKGRLLYQNCRFEPKCFRQRRSDGNGGYFWDLKGITRTLYRLPELIESSMQEWVFLTEGEKDTNRMISLGFAATTSGSSTSWKPEFARFFKGRLVCIVPHFDASGIKFALTAADSLYNVAGEVRILDLPGLDEGQDVSNWIDAGGTTERLLELIEQTKTYKPKPERQIPYTILSSVDSQEVYYLMPEVLPLGMITSLVSQEGVGKSTLASAITAHVTTGTPWPNAPKESNIEGHVIIFSHEEDVSRVLVPRLIVNGADLERVVAGEAIIKMRDGKELPFAIDRNVPELDLLIDEFPETRLVIFDPITSYVACKENSNAEVRQALKPLVDLATRRNIAVLALTHLNKKIDLGMINRSIGSRAWSAVPRIIWGIRAEQIEDADGNKTETENRFLLNVKCNIGPKPRGLKFAIGEGGRVTWHSERVMMSMDSDFKVKQSRPEETADWLQCRLAHGAALSSTIFDEAKERGFSRNSCFQAKKLLNIRVTREGFGSEGQWFWELQDES